MFWNNEFIGLALEGDHIRMAHIKKQGNKISLVRLDTYELVENITSADKKEISSTGGDQGVSTQESQQESTSENVFGFGEEASTGSESSKEEIDFEDLEASAARDEDLGSLDMVNESEGEVSSNPVLFYNILMDADPKAAQVGLNIAAGETIFQIITDTDFNEVKTRDLVEDLENKLESIYGKPKSPDNYAYEIREDGSLLLASVERESALLTIANEASDIYNGKLEIKSVFPDEVALIGLLKAHYQLNKGQITALIQFGTNRCRIVFMDGERILEVMPMVNQGTKNSNFLNTIFSKILFQLDSGKVPDLDQIILANNTLGEEALQFFRQQFPDMTVEGFEFNEEKFDSGSYEYDTVSNFTASIAAACAASKVDEQELPTLSFLPSYVRERQKIFKLQWHGLLLLVLIFLSIPTINYFYQKNAEHINALSSDLKLTNARIDQIEPLVQQTNEISNNLSLLTSKLALLDSLSEGSKTWSTKLDILDHGMSRVPNSWLTSLSNTKDGTFMEGYTLYRNRVPAIVDLFAEGTLLNVSIEQIRDEEIFRYSMIIREFTADSSRYSPEKSQSIEKLLSN